MRNIKKCFIERLCTAINRIDLAIKVKISIQINQDAM